VRSASALAFTVIMAAIFGVGLLTGLEFGNGAALNFLPIRLGPPPVAIPPLAGTNDEAAREAAIAKIKPAVVRVNVTTDLRDGNGSGVIVDSRGYIVTNYHVISGAQSLQVVFADGSRTSDVQLAGTDPVDDLAVLKVTPPANMAVATLGDSSQLRVGQEVLAAGSPLGLAETVTHGIVSALGRSVSEPNGPIIPSTIQTDAPFNPGNSGGALTDLQGNVIGIPTLAAYDSRFDTLANGVGFAIPINQVKRILPQIIQDGMVTHTGRAALGIYDRGMNDNLQARLGLAVDHGVLVTGFPNNGGPAEQAGLQTGDVIVAVNGKPADNPLALADMLAAQAPGDKVSLTIYRGEQQVTFSIALGELSAYPD
jgi:S1-C subfamily serine protease